MDVDDGFTLAASLKEWLWQELWGVEDTIPECWGSRDRGDTNPSASTPIMWDLVGALEQPAAAPCPPELHPQLLNLMESLPPADGAQSAAMYPVSLLLPLQQYRLLRPKIKGTGYSLTVLVTIEGGRYPVVVDGVWKGELSKTSVLWVVVSCAELPPLRPPAVHELATLLGRAVWLGTTGLSLTWHRKEHPLNCGGAPAVYTPVLAEWNLLPPAPAPQPGPCTWTPAATWRGLLPKQRPPPHVAAFPQPIVGAGDLERRWYRLGDRLWLSIGVYLVQRRTTLWDAYRSLVAQHLCYVRKVRKAIVQCKDPPKALKLFKSWEYSNVNLPPEAGAVREAVDFLRSRERDPGTPSEEEEDEAFDSFCVGKGIVEPLRTRVLLATITLRQRLGEEAVRRLGKEEPLPQLLPAPLISIPLCARPGCEQQVPPLVRCTTCHLRLWCSPACRRVHRDQHAPLCWRRTTQPQLPDGVANPWVVTAHAFDVRLTTSLDRQPLAEVMRLGRVPQVHPWFGVLYAPPDEQAINYPIPVAPGLPPDSPPGAALETEVQQGAPQEEVCSGTEDDPVPLDSPFRSLRLWLREGLRGKPSPLQSATLTKAARVAMAEFRNRGPVWAALSQFLHKKGHSLLPALADLLLARLFRPRLKERQRILSPSDSSLICRYLSARARVPAVARRDRRGATTPRDTSEALARLRKALRESWVTYIPYQQGGWWVLLRAQRAEGSLDMTITCFNPPPGAAGKLGITRFIHLCEQQSGYRVHKTPPLQPVCEKIEHSGLHMLSGLAELMADGDQLPRPITLQDRPKMRSLVVAFLGTPSPRQPGEEDAASSYASLPA